MSFIFGLIFFASVSTISTGRLSSRVVGGIDADWREVPYIISLRSNSLHVCGGVLISKNWVLTAAHCVTSSVAKYSIQYGVLNISSIEDDISVIDVKSIKIHEEFDPFTTENDIAALKLKKSAKLGEFVSVATLPKQNEDVPLVDNALLAGWGQIYTNGPLSTSLQKVEISVINMTICRGMHFLEIFDTNLCAGKITGGKGHCKNDAGSPLNVNGKVVGIVSWSAKPCAFKHLPGIYTNLASYRDWIRITTEV